MVAKPLCPLYKNIIKPLDRARYPELRYDWYNHHRTCECGEKLPFKQTIIQCTKSQNVLGRPLLIVSVPVPHHVSLLLKCF